MFDRRAIMQDAWARYRIERAGFSKFSPAAFRRCLLQAWEKAKFRARYANQSPVLVGPVDHRTDAQRQMDARIDALKYLSARYDIAAMERSIRAEYARAA
ncbi:MAG: hypothetical protein VYD57_09650 [Pseudomonadota bacterium]|nr:hypothetical protein [Pseudomonadota bacterium]